MFAVLSVIALIASALLGTWFLCLVFEDIGPYTYLFVPIIVTTLLISVNAALFPVCTVLKEIKGQLANMRADSVLCFVCGVRKAVCHGRSCNCTVDYFGRTDYNRDILRIPQDEKMEGNRTWIK